MKKVERTEKVEKGKGRYWIFKTLRPVKSEDYFSQSFHDYS